MIQLVSKKPFYKQNRHISRYEEVPDDTIKLFDDIREKRDK